MRFKATTVAVAVAFVATAASAPAAAADGLPVAGVDVKVGKTGVALPGAPDRFVAVRVGEDTLIARTSQEDGSVLDTTRASGELTIPAVAYDGTSAGLSSDGSTLALIQPRRNFPQRETTLALYDAKKLELRERITLEGDFSYDALSPDGSLLYLIEYESLRDPTRYAVRVYDTRRGRLEADPIVDPTEPNEEMAGLPMTREMSPDGRWAYTLYEPTHGEPFVHALDTKRGTAACIDLPQLSGEPGQLGLNVAPEDGAMTVLLKGQPTLEIDPEGFGVTKVDEPATAPQPAEGDSFPWILAGLAAAGGLGLFAWLRMRRRREDGGPTEAELAELVDVDDSAEERETPVARR